MMPQDPFKPLSEKGLEQIRMRLNMHQREVMHIQDQYAENQREFSQLLLRLMDQASDEAILQSLEAEQSESLDKHQHPTSSNVCLSKEQLLGFWRPVVGIEHPVAETIYMALYHQFVEDIVLESAEDFYHLGKRPRLYLANHQVGIESILFMFVVSALSGCVINAIAKTEHQQSWMGEFTRHIYSYPHIKDPELLFYFKRDNPLSMLQLLQSIKTAILQYEHSLLVHVQGTRSLSCRQEIEDVSAVFIDLALELDLPIVPVKFKGGLPIEPLQTRLEFPCGYARQNYHIGRAIYPDILKLMGNVERKTLILERLNQLGGTPLTETPSVPDDEFEQVVKQWMSQTGAPEVQAVLYNLLEQHAHPASELQAVLTGIHHENALLLNTEKRQWLQSFRQWLQVDPFLTNM